ncbi:hypothetical protein PCL_00796 [Purpureocillium lilacinum]|uniref:Uncharacterized protein n=1 Tax=Purpureocillium lilacinum TaxID=33203 RepID=A0A2U3E5Y8_PURLI|nr:hypothetical protein PCL_00796 [Purpureocillium lilacinum]
MADDAENGSLEVECFTTASGSFIKYGYVVMRKPDVELSCSEDYLNWFHGFRKCASDAGLLGHFDGKAARPKQGPQRNEFDQKQAALNNFILETVEADYLGGYSKKNWQDDPRNTQTFDQTQTSVILQHVKDSLDGDAPLEEFATNYRSWYNCEWAISQLNDEWDNINAIRANTPDYFYHFGAWSLANEYDLHRIRNFYVKSAPKMPSIEEVKQALRKYCRKW